jgi:hypothetical protein
VTGGALACTEDRWIPTHRRQFLFPVKALSKVFRGKYLDGLSHAYRQGTLRFAAGTASLHEGPAFQQWLAQLWHQDWVVYAKAPFASAHHVVSYLGRYTHRVAISNERLVALEDGLIHFRWRDYRQGNRSLVMALPAEEFIRRFLLHTLPHGLQRLRHYGVLGNRCRAQKLARCRTLFAQLPPPPRTGESTAEVMRRLAGVDIDRCPHCPQGRLRLVGSLLPWPQPARRPMTTEPP